MQTDKVQQNKQLKVYFGCLHIQYIIKRQISKLTSSWKHCLKFNSNHFTVVRFTQAQFLQKMSGSSLIVVICPSVDLNICCCAGACLLNVKSAEFPSAIPLHFNLMQHIELSYSNETSPAYRLRCEVVSCSRYVLMWHEAKTNALVSDVCLHLLLASWLVIWMLRHLGADWGPGSS